MEEKNNQQTKEQIQAQGIEAIIKLVLIIIVLAGTFYYVFVIIPKQGEEESTTTNILSALNQSGYEYTNKSTFTEEDFTIEEVEKSDYKPIYKVNISNGDTLYICLIYANGNKGGYKTNDRFIISKNLDRLKNSINQ